MYRQSFRNVSLAFTLACLPFIFARDVDAASLRPRATILVAPTNAHSWCLLSVDGRTDCSFTEQNQCEAAATGNVGECVLIPPAYQPRD